MNRSQSYRTVLMSLAFPLAAGTVLMGQAPGPADPAIQKNVTEQMNRETVVPVRATKLLGMEIYNHQDKHLGEIKDIVLDSTGRRVGYAVLSHGGILGIGDKLFAIPYRSVEYSSVKDAKAYVSLNEQALKNAPGFDAANWPDKADAVVYYKQADDYYKTVDARAAAARMDAMDAPMDEGLTWTRRLSSLVGANVESPTGENLGEIKDVVIDWQTGKVQYTVLSFGGLMGIGDKLFAIPSDQFKTKPDSRELVLAMDKDRLKNAPGFDQNNWPNFADLNWRRTNDQFYMPQP